MLDGFLYRVLRMEVVSIQVPAVMMLLEFEPETLMAYMSSFCYYREIVETLRCETLLGRSVFPVCYLLERL